jgi:hypothetical protein
MQALVLVGFAMIALLIAVLLFAKLVTLAASVAVAAVPSLIVFWFIVMVLRGMLRSLL